MSTKWTSKLEVINHRNINHVEVSDEELTLTEKIKARYLGFDVEKPCMFLEVYEQHNKEFEALVGKRLSYRTLQKYKTIKAYVADF